MTANVGGIDKTLRLALGVLLLALVFVGPQTYWGLIGLVLIATALFNFCPLYPLIGFSSQGHSDKN